MAYKDKLFVVLFCFFGACLFIYLISGILLPFIVAIIAAYFLNPAANKIQKLGVSRTIATTIITVTFFIISIILTTLLAPLLYNQFLTFLSIFPTYIDYIKLSIIPSFSHFLERIDPHAVEKVKDSVGDISGYVLKFMGSLVANLLNSGIAALNLLSLLFITPIVTFYMLRDWGRMTSTVNSLLPLKYAGTIKKQIKEIDNILAGYIRGQTHVCLIIGTYYAVSLTIAGLQFSAFIGFTTGLLLFIPYVGSIFGFTVAMLVAFFQFGDAQHLSIIAGIFLIGQIIEGVVITPNLVGNKVRLHPVFIMFSLLAGGAVFGFLGVLIAVPTAAVVGVLARFFIGEYLKNRLYSKA